ncbi:MAG: hypothetical protein QXU18_09275 [Thermoplasmatales archaeon]
MLWETDINYVSTVHDVVTHLISVKDSFVGKLISCEFSISFTAKDCIKVVNKAYSVRSPDCKSGNIGLRTDNGIQYISKIFKNIVRLLGIRLYHKKNTP